MEKPESIPKEFQVLFRDLVVAFQPRALDREAARVYYAALGGFPMDVLRESAYRLTRQQSFFPTTGEWCQVVREIERERLRAMASTGRAREEPDCARCSDTGSVYAECPGDATCGRDRPHAAHGFVCVCSCRQTNRAYQAKQAALTLFARGGTE